MLASQSPSSLQSGGAGHRRSSIGEHVGECLTLLSLLPAPQSQSREAVTSAPHMCRTKTQSRLKSAHLGVFQGCVLIREHSGFTPPSSSDISFNSNSSDGMNLHALGMKSVLHTMRKCDPREKLHLAESGGEDHCKEAPVKTYGALR